MYRINLQRLCHETNKVFTLREVFLYTCTGKLDVWTFNGETDHPSRNCVVARFFVPWDYDSHFCKWSLKCLNIRYIISNRKVTSWFFFILYFITTMGLRFNFKKHFFDDSVSFNKDKYVLKKIFWHCSLN